MTKRRFLTPAALPLAALIPLFLFSDAAAVESQPTSGAAAAEQKGKSPSAEVASSPSVSPADGEKPVVRRISKDVYRIGDIAIDTKERTVAFPAKVNLIRGVLEVLICTEYGKTHESLLSTKVDPLHLNVALLMLGLEGGNAVRYQGDPTQPLGSPVEIWLNLGEGDKQRRLRAEDWVTNTPMNRPMLHTHWVYVGSVLTKDGFMAQREGQIVTTFHDPMTLIDNPLPGGGDDTVYVVNTEAVPPQGTELTVVIKAVSPPTKKR
jgi:hypothetical protein